MRRKLTAIVLSSAFALALPAATASAAINEGPGKGNPDTNPTGKCPPGQNQDTSPGGQKKCP
jgi:hypothetical protein